MTSALYGVYGASGCGRSVMPVARLQLQAAGAPADRLVFVDDASHGGTVNGHAVLSYAKFRQAEASQRFAVIAIANGATRQRLAERNLADGIEPWTVQADSATVMDDVSIGEGAILSPYVTLTSNIRVGLHFHANLYSYVEHDCVIGDFVTFAPSVKCNGNVLIEDHAYIGAGAILRQGKPGEPLVIGRGAVIGMGAVVTKNVAAGDTVIGNPARSLGASVISC